MPYPNSPFSDDFNDDSLIPASCTLENKDVFLKILKKWLCKTPKVTTIRVDPSRECILPIIEQQLSEICLMENGIAQPKVYKHSSLDMIVIEHLDEKHLQLEKVSKEVMVDAKCAAAILRGAHVFAPGVIGMTKDCNLNDIISIYVDTNITNKCKKGFAAIFASPNKHFIANGRVKLTRNQLFCSEPIKTGIAIEIISTISGCPPLNHNFLHFHAAMLQNAPSIVAVECLGLTNRKSTKPLRVLDMCASPGGKTVHIATKLNKLPLDGAGETQQSHYFMACDKPHKMAALKRTCDLYNLKNIRIEAIDWLESTKNMDAFMADILNHPFDAILLDAPCSATGNRPCLVNFDSAKVLGSFVAVQKRLLRTAVKMLKPFGILVYSTCSIAVPENEGLVAYALKKCDLELLPAEPKHGGDGLPHDGLEEHQLKLLQRFGPDINQIQQDNLDNLKIDEVWQKKMEENDGNNSIGFFIAKFRKKST